MGIKEKSIINIVRQHLPEEEAAEWERLYLSKIKRLRTELGRRVAWFELPEEDFALIPHSRRMVGDLEWRLTEAAGYWELSAKTSYYFSLPWDKPRLHRERLCSMDGLREIRAEERARGEEEMKNDQDSGTWPYRSGGLFFLKRAGEYELVRKIVREIMWEVAPLGLSEPVKHLQKPHLSHSRGFIKAISCFFDLDMFEEAEKYLSIFEKAVGKVNKRSGYATIAANGFRHRLNAIQERDREKQLRHAALAIFEAARLDFLTRTAMGDAESVQGLPVSSPPYLFAEFEMDSETCYGLSQANEMFYSVAIRAHEACIRNNWWLIDWRERGALATKEEVVDVLRKASPEELTEFAKRYLENW